MIFNISFDVDETKLEELIGDKNMASVDWKELREELIEGYKERLEDDISDILDGWREETGHPQP